jgi:hypothetical protein
VRHLLLFLHIAGFVLWMGGGFSIMAITIAMGKEPRERLGLLVRLIGVIHRSIVLPGVLMEVLSGLLLTLSLYSQASATGFPVPLMVMQGTGLLAAGLVFVINVPTLARLGRIDPVGEYAATFDALRRRADLSGSLTALLALTALVTGVLLR